MAKYTGDVYDFGGDIAIALFDATTQTVLHKHAYYEFSVTVKDGYYHIVDGKELRVKNGDVVLLRPGDVHRLVAIPGSESLCLNILIPSSIFVGVCDDLSPKLYSKITSFSQAICFPLSDITLAALARRMSEPVYIVAGSMLSGAQKEIYHQLQKCIAYEMTGYLLNSELFAQRQFPVCIERLLLFLDDKDNLCLGVTAIAAAVAYSPSYLSRQFRKHFNMTLEQYIINQRLIRAKDLLLNTELPAERIAAMTGWNKPTSFSRAFRSLYGVTPKKFKESSKTPPG